MHPRHGELLPNGFHVGGLITYGRGERFGMVIPDSGGRDRANMVRALFADTAAAAEARYARVPVERGTTALTAEVRLIRNYEGSSTMTAETEGPLDVSGAVAQDLAFDGTPGTFVPHDGSIPEPGTIVRAFATGNPMRQVEGLFLRMEGSEALVERKRRRSRRSGADFSEWETYSTGGRSQVVVEGATVFKAGATAPAALVRTTAITNERDQRAIAPGMILSASVQGRHRGYIYRGDVIQVDFGGPVTLMATERCEAPADRRNTGESYDWQPVDPPEEVHVHCTWIYGQDGFMQAGWLWERTGSPAVRPVDPAFDPSRKTRYTGMAIGDLVVGLLRESEYGRDTVSSWVKGTIIKWDTRTGRPIVKITDPMESDKKVDQEAVLIEEDVYPAMADPASVSPEEYKRTLRLYLIGRHKRGDFCRGGLNTMLAAHGIPLYETRRRAVMQITVDYDPNATDLYTVQSSLQRGLPGVQGLMFSERSGTDVELSVESDQTVG